jgi:hypothetical protein
MGLGRSSSQLISHRKPSAIRKLKIGKAAMKFNGSS